MTEKSYQFFEVPKANTKTFLGNEPYLMFLVRCTPAVYFYLTSNADSRCYTKFDWLRKNVVPIKYHVKSLLTSF